jgi:hypothetical protein
MKGMSTPRARTNSSTQKPGHCTARETLQREASEVLQRLIDITENQLKALAANDYQSLMRLDKELDLAFGAKERSFGALHEHTKEHGC